MNVLMINASPRENSNTAAALSQMQKVFSENAIDTTVVRIGSQIIRGCIACGTCKRTGKCVFDDAVNELAPALERADGLVVGTPVYYASANATLVAFMDRLFCSTPFDKTMKVGAAIASARRSGLTSTFDELNKYFAIAGMPIATGQYWNGIHGGAVGEAQGDEEGMQMMRTLARNMSFLIKSIALGKAAYSMPEREAQIKTNFIR